MYPKQEFNKMFFLLLNNNKVNRVKNILYVRSIIYMTPLKIMILKTVIEHSPGKRWVKPRAVYDIDESQLSIVHDRVKSKLRTVRTSVESQLSIVRYIGEPKLSTVRYIGEPKLSAVWESVPTKLR